MKFKSKAPWWLYMNYFILQSISTVFIVFAIIKTEFEVRLPFSIIAGITGLLFILSLPHLLFTYYIVGERELYLSGGWFKKNIRFERIKSVEIIKGYVTTSFALSTDRVKIGYINENGKLKDVFISPADRQEFVNCICNKNPNIKS